MFCPNCGKPIDDNATTCPECGVTIARPVRKAVKLDPVVLISAIFSCIAFIFGFTIVTTTFVNKWGISYVEFAGLLPAFVGLGTGVYKLARGGLDGTSKRTAAISVLASCFILIYAFIGIMVFLCN